MTVKRNQLEIFAKKYLLWVMLAAFLVFRFMYLNADPSGPYMNTDEGHHCADARAIVLYGTPFYDTYNPCVLMPFFTLFKVPFMAVFGVGYVGMRIPSALCVMGAVLLFCRILQGRGEYLAANLVMFYVGVSYFFFTHSRLGIHEPVLVFFVALTLYMLYQAFESRRTSLYVWAFVCAFTVPLIKTSGVFVYGVLGICLLYKLIFDRENVNLKGVIAGVVISVALWFLLWLFWFRPHWDDFTWQWAMHINPATPSFLGSIQQLAFRLLFMAPFLFLMCAVRGVVLVNDALTEPRQCDSLELILFSWVICACAPLIYGSLWFPRWMMWMMLPLAVIAIRQFVNLATSPRQNPHRQRWVQISSVIVFIVGIAAGNFPEYRAYYRTIDFSMERMAKATESLVGTNLVTGIGWSGLSPKVNFYFDRTILPTSKGPPCCDDIRRAFPTEAKTPRFIGCNVGGDPSKFGERVNAWRAICPEWTSQYQPFAIYRRIDYGGIYEVWLVRTNQAPTSVRLFNPPGSGL